MKIRNVFGDPTVSGLTIDDAGTRDIDDAIWVEESATEWKATISITDVAAYVKDASEDDQRARRMAETRYFGSGNSPMLRRDLSEGVLSLWPAQKRRVLAITILVDKQTLINTKVTVSHERLVSIAKLSYREIPWILENAGLAHHAMLTSAASLAQVLLDMRRSNGALVLYDLNNGWVTTEDGFLRRIESHEATVGYIIIQELMILANSAVARWAVEQDIPILFRNHVARTAAPDRAELQRQLEGAVAHPIQGLDALRQRTHLLLDRASYGSSVLGHYGLNLPVYTHFTSPIRRYADLINQRQIRRSLKDGSHFYTKEQIGVFAEQIAAVMKSEDAAVSRVMKERSEQKAARAIGARQIDSLAHKDFERVTKVEARSGKDPSAAFADAFTLRTKEDKTPLLAMTVVLMSAPMTAAWLPLRAVIIGAMARRPEDATSALAQASQLDPGWATPRYEVTNSELGVVPMFEVTASIMISGIQATGTARAARKRQAEHLAAVALLAWLSGVPVPELATKPAPRTPCGKTAPAPPMPTLNPTQDPISTLHEWAQINSTVPSYQFEMTGPPHMPSVVCVCKVLERVAQAKAGSKKEAKRGAAIEMIRALGAGAR
jgi:ribonuclease R